MEPLNDFQNLRGRFLEAWTRLFSLHVLVPEVTYIHLLVLCDLDSFFNYLRSPPMVYEVLYYHGRTMSTRTNNQISVEYAGVGQSP